MNVIQQREETLEQSVIGWFLHSMGSHCKLHENMGLSQAKNQ